MSVFCRDDEAVTKQLADLLIDLVLECNKKKDKNKFRDLEVLFRKEILNRKNRRKKQSNKTQQENAKNQVPARLVRYWIHKSFTAAHFQKLW